MTQVENGAFVLACGVLLACAEYSPQGTFDEVDTASAPFVVPGPVPEPVRLEGAALAGAEVTGLALQDPEPPPMTPLCDAVENPRCDRCEPGFSCAGGFCGGTVCSPGRPCTDADDCGGGECTEAGLCTSAERCASRTDCLYGHTCESTRCVDRRIPCGVVGSGCPRGMACTFVPVEGRPFCIPANPPCESDGGCEPGARCTGEGNARHCIPAGLCTTDADCPEGRFCGVDPATSQSSCEVDGPCDGDCPAGRLCRDPGSGPRCVVPGGSCASDAECPARMRCASPGADDPLHCIGHDAGSTDEASDDGSATERGTDR